MHLATAIKAIPVQQQHLQLLLCLIFRVTDIGHLLHKIKLMLCCCCYLCKVNIGVMLPESTLGPLGGGWQLHVGCEQLPCQSGYTPARSPSCLCMWPNCLCVAKLSLHVANYEFQVYHQSILFGLCYLLLKLMKSGPISRQLDSWSPARSTARNKITRTAQAHRST